jgi:hypothetical protein
MVKREVIRTLEEKGLFCDCIKVGLIGANVKSYVNWYDRYQQLIKMGSGKLDAYTIIAEENGVSEGFVRKKVKEFGS